MATAAYGAMPLTICMALVQRRLPGKCTAQVFAGAGALSSSVIAWILLANTCGGTNLNPATFRSDLAGRLRASRRNAWVPAFPRPAFALFCGFGADPPSAGVVQW